MPTVDAAAARGVNAGSEIDTGAHPGRTAGG